MSYATLAIHQKQLTLPDDWLEDFPTDTVVAARLGDVLVIRPIETVTYSPEAEQQVLEAIAEFDKEKEAGLIRELGDKGFEELRAEAEELERMDANH